MYSAADAKKIADIFTAKLPILAETLNEHLRDYDEILLHPLLADFVRAVSDAYIKDNRPPNQRDNIYQLFAEAIEEALLSGGFLARNAFLVTVFPILETIPHSERLIYFLGPLGRHTYEEAMIP